MNREPMRFFGMILLCCCSFAGISQSNCKIFVEKQGDKKIFYAQNNEFCPVSIQVTLELNNMTSTGFGNGIFVIPEYAQKYQLFELTGIKPRRKTTYSYNYRAVFGDIYKMSFDQDHRYDLPFKSGSRYRIEQGYNGRFTHQGENALDFNMPEGSQVRAARAGVVIAVVQRYNETCLREECKTMANYVLIFHSDGTIADYSHLKYNEARVAVGDTVKKGDLLALSGSTGYARGPHLHFVCYLPDLEKRRTVKTKFRTGNGSVSAYLVENKVYSKAYK
jgi:murein DD-endopeptidase MepM/ murein hydrolase activator NlpD